MKPNLYIMQIKVCEFSSLPSVILRGPIHNEFEVLHVKRSQQCNTPSLYSCLPVYFAKVPTIDLDASKVMKCD